MVPVEDLIVKAEFMLNLHLLESYSIDRAFYRFSSKKYLTKKQFILACKNLKIDLKNNSTKSFFIQFFDPVLKLFSVRLLSTLGILLGKGESFEKVNLLFHNYDNDTNLKLSRDELSQLFEDISMISFKYLPTYAMQFADVEAKSSIEKYIQDLMNMKTSVVKYYVSTVFEDLEKDEIEMSAFLKILKGTKVASMLTPALFRKYTLEIWKNIEKAVRAVNFILDETNADSSHVFEKIQIVDIDQSVRLKIKKFHSS
jgi:Ca2+-binding EF-hand superfamily protein